MMDWQERADLAERMWPVAASFACMVHDGDAQGVEAFLKAFDPAEADARAVVLAAMIPVETATPGELLAWVGGSGDDPELPLEWPGEGEPEPAGYTARELRDAAAEAMRLRRANREVPPELAARVLAYRVWRKQVQGVRKRPAVVPEATETADAA